MQLLQKTSLAAVLGLAICLSAPVQAETIHLVGTLSAGSEVPPNDSPGKGNVDATFDTSTGNLSWTVNYSGLTGDAVAAHFHGPAVAGANAGIVVPITGALASPIKGEAKLTPDQSADLLSGKWYFNIHTAAHKGGELRAQVMRAP